MSDERRSLSSRIKDSALKLLGHSRRPKRSSPQVEAQNHGPMDVAADFAASNHPSQSQPAKNSIATSPESSDHPSNAPGPSNLRAPNPRVTDKSDQPLVASPNPPSTHPASPDITPQSTQPIEVTVTAREHPGGASATHPVSPDEYSPRRSRSVPISKTTPINPSRHTGINAPEHTSPDLSTSELHHGLGEIALRLTKGALKGMKLVADNIPLPGAKAIPEILLGIIDCVEVKKCYSYVLASVADCFSTSNLKRITKALRH